MGAAEEMQSLTAPEAGPVLDEKLLSKLLKYKGGCQVAQGGVKKGRNVYQGFVLS